jgi:gamma-tubulin complex component 3
MKYPRVFNNLKDIELDFLRCNLIRNEMNHFISNLLNYIMLEVIESSYNNLTDQLDEAMDLNHLIEIHEKFVLDILEKGLLT